jgi:DNA segregation ATPase FtsK/SpoIIIE, S-DNA-T family
MPAPVSRKGFTPHPANRNRPPLLPLKLRAALHEQVWLWLGGLWFLAALGCFAILASYHPDDPSFNSIALTPSEPRNLLGSIGAYAADILMQFFGFAAYWLCVVFAAWGWRMTSGEGLDHWRGRCLMLVLALICCGVAFESLAQLFETLSSLSLWERGGGAFGVVLTELLLFPPLPLSLQLTLILLLSLALTCGAIFMACALTLRQWSNVWKFCRQMAAHAIIWSKSGVIRLRALITREPVTLDDPRVPQPEEVVAAKPSAPSKPRKSSKPRQSSRAQPQAQLPFDDQGTEFVLPPLDVLAKPEASRGGRDMTPEAMQRNASLLENVLRDYGIQGQITHVSPGPVVTLYELEPAPGIRAARIVALADDIARSMSVRSVRVAVVPGRNVIGIEMPNQKREIVLLRELLESPAYHETPHALPLVLGKDIAGVPIIADLARMPHLLVAGTTGSGKSVSVNTMILSLLYRLSPEQCRFIMIDPKMLELSVYEGIPHLLAPVVTEPKKAVVALKWTVREMEERYRAMSKLGVRNIDGYNLRIRQAREKGEALTRQVQTGFDPATGKPVFEEQPFELVDLPYIVVIVDEMADLMLVAGKDIEVAVQRLAQMARAAGIHIVMATQRPSVDVITGTIKANFPTRISFQVTSKIDSRTILGEMGAEQLLGQGDMLYMAGGGRITRVHAPFVRDSEVEKVVNFLKAQGEPDYLTEVTEEDESADAFGDGFGSETGDSGNALYDMAVDIVQREGKASTSFLQRSLKLGYNRAATLIERMEKEGVVSAANHVGKREVFNRRG